jgi:hypothetical protein
VENTRISGFDRTVVVVVVGEIVDFDNNAEEAVAKVVE